MSESNSEAKNPLAALQQVNPKILYGAGAGVFLLLWFILSGSGGGNVEVKLNVSQGQAVTLVNPNGGKSLIDEQPGRFSAREEDETFVCFADSGSGARVEEETMIPMLGGQPLPFVKVEITTGSCAGKHGWTAKTNLKG